MPDMRPVPEPRPEIGRAPRDLPFTLDIRRVHLAVGWVAFGLPLSLLALGLLPQVCFYTSISHFYFSPVGGDLFVGMLSFIGLLLLCLYSFDMTGRDGTLGWHWYDVALIRVAGIAALLVAFVPTRGSGCAFGGGAVPRAFVGGAEGSEDFPAPASPPDTVAGAPSFDFWGQLLGLERTREPGVLDAVHYAAAGVMFLILAYVVLWVFTRVNSDTALRAGNRKDLRNRCYAVLGRMILASVAVLAVKSGLGALLPDGAGDGFLSVWNGFRLTFVFEALGLFAFGLAWMIKGRFLRFFEDAHHPRAA